jgi:AraC family transcriptional regulator
MSTQPKPSFIPIPAPDPQDYAHLHPTHQLAAERIIAATRQQLDRNITIDEMAKIAWISPFHLIRVFQKITGIPPCRFRSAMRLATAKQLLVTTNISIIDICFDVGYNSLGTFARRFTDLIGFPPLFLRRLATTGFGLSPARLEQALPILSANGRAGATIEGSILTSGQPYDLVFVGLFPTAVAQGNPVACSVLRHSGYYRLTGVPDGAFYLIAAALSMSHSVVDLLLQDPTIVGVDRKGPILVHDGLASRGVDLQLRPRRVTDPPILLALLPKLALALSSYAAAAPPSLGQGHSALTLPTFRKSGEEPVLETPYK